MNPIDDTAWQTLLLDARTHQGWTDAPVDDALLARLYTLARMGPTAMNCQPLRVVFVRSPEARARLKPALAAGNVDKTMAAPVTAILAYDTHFHDHMDLLAPHAPGASERLGSLPPEDHRTMAQRNAHLQAGYLIVTARGLGLDCGPMAGFDAERLDAAFFPDGLWRSFLLVNLGHGDPSRLRPRAPRLDFDTACRVV
jgi:3-hydroxypropanoate dehydrogenase